MREYAEEPMTVVKEVIRHRRCDLCGKPAHHARGDWSDHYHQIVETEIKQVRGDRYPEGGTLEETTVDLCPDCFEGKLLPWLRAQEVIPQVREVRV